MVVNLALNIIFDSLLFFKQTQVAFGIHPPLFFRRESLSRFGGRDRGGEYMNFRDCCRRRLLQRSREESTNRKGLSFASLITVFVISLRF
jgi:hypothetical protein